MAFNTALVDREETQGDEGASNSNARINLSFTRPQLSTPLMYLGYLRQWME